MSKGPDDELFESIVKHYEKAGRLVQRPLDFLNAPPDADGNRIDRTHLARIRYDGGAIGELRIESVMVSAGDTKRRITWTTNVGSEGAYIPPKGEAGSLLTEIRSCEHAIATIDRLQPSP